MVSIGVRAPIETPMFDANDTMASAWQMYFATLADQINAALTVIRADIDAEIEDLNITGSLSMDGAKIIDELRNLRDIGDIDAETLTTSGNVVVGGDASVTGDISAGGEVSGGTADIEENADVGGDLAVTGEVGGGTADITGNASVGGDLDVTSGEVAGNILSVTDGVTAPDTQTGRALIYVDTADGDLKVKFGDGHVTVIAADS